MILLLLRKSTFVACVASRSYDSFGHTTVASNFLNHQRLDADNMLYQSASPEYVLTTLSYRVFQDTILVVHVVVHVNSNLETKSKWALEESNKADDLHSWEPRAWSLAHPFVHRFVVRIHNCYLYCLRMGWPWKESVCQCKLGGVNTRYITFYPWKRYHTQAAFRIEQQESNQSNQSQGSKWWKPRPSKYTHNESILFHGLVSLKKKTTWMKREWDEYGQCEWEEEGMNKDDYLLCCMDEILSCFNHHRSMDTFAFHNLS